MSDLTHSDLLVTRGDFDHFGLPAFVSFFFRFGSKGCFMARIDLTLSRLSTAGDHYICKEMEAINPTAHSQIMCRIVMAGL